MVFAAISAIPGSVFAQTASVGIAPLAPLNAEQQLSVERLIRSDPRILQLVGPGNSRVIVGNPEFNKTEAQAFLTSAAARPPTRRISAIVFNRQTNRAASAIVAIEQRRIVAVGELAAVDVPFVREDVLEAFALARRDPAVRRAVGESIDRYSVVDSGTDGPRRNPFVVQGLPVRSVNAQDTCSVDRCLDLIFRAERGYLAFRAHADITKGVVTVEGSRPR